MSKHKKREKVFSYVDKLMVKRYYIPFTEFEWQKLASAFGFEEMTPHDVKRLLNAVANGQLKITK